MSGHTPGPWEYEPNGMGCHIVFMGEQVTKRFTLPFFADYQESEANARLIAAAPELLEALKTCKVAMDADSDAVANVYEAMDADSDAVANVYEVVCTAIDKAEGRDG